MSETVGFIVVSYWGSDQVARLLASLTRQTDPRWHVVVVDNSQDEGESQKLSALAVGDKRVRVVDPGSNLGYFGGASHALGETDPLRRWVGVCNADLELDSDVVAHLMCRSIHGVGVLAPSIRSSKSGRDQNPYMRTRPSRWTTERRYWMFRWTPLSRLMVASSTMSARAGYRASPRKTEVETPIYAPHGSCIFFSATYFERGGTMDHPVFLFGEEVTVAEACRDLGLSVEYVPRVLVTHHEHQATGVWRSAWVLRQQREAARYARRRLATSKGHTKLTKESG